jgi:hypothetical protein
MRIPTLKFSYFLLILGILRSQRPLQSLLSGIDQRAGTELLKGWEKIETISKSEGSTQRCPNREQLKKEYPGEQNSLMR